MTQSRTTVPSVICFVRRFLVPAMVLLVLFTRFPGLQCFVAGGCFEQGNGSEYALTPEGNQPTLQNDTENSMPTNPMYDDPRLAALGGLLDRAQDLYLSCKERRDHYLELKMLEEAAAFERLMEKIAHGFSLPGLGNDGPLGKKT